MAFHRISILLWGAALLFPMTPLDTSATASASPPNALPIELGQAEPRMGKVDGYTVDTARLAARASEGEPFEENIEAMEAEREMALARGAEDHTQNACHYARGSTLILHVFIDHQWGSWDESERNEAAAKALVAKEFYLEQAPAAANLSFDNGTTGTYFYVQAYVDSTFSGETGWNAANAAMAALGITDSDGDGFLADDYSLDTQFWNGGYDNVILVFQVANSFGTAFASTIMSACFMNSNEAGNIWAHEWGHMFGACDEYRVLDDDTGEYHCHKDVDCGACTRAWYLDEDYNNGNCERTDCPSDVECVMQHNTMNLCSYTWDLLSWEDEDGNGQLDWTKRFVGTNEYDIMEMWNGGSFIHNTTDASFVAAVTEPSWTVFGLRSPLLTNYDLRLYWDNTLTYQPAWSGQTGRNIDFIVGDYSRSRTGLEHLQVERATGLNDNYNVVWQGNGSSVYADGVSRNVVWDVNDVVQIRNLTLYAGETVTFDLEPSGGVDAGMALFWSYGDFYFAGRHQALWEKDAAGTNGTETYTYDVPSTGTYGFVFWANNAAAGNVAISIGPGPITLVEETPLFSAAPLRLFNYTAILGNWAGVATRPDAGTDVSLSVFDDPMFVEEEATSNEPGDELELIAVNYISQPADTDHLRVPKLSGAGGYRTEWEQSSDQLTGVVSDTWAASHVVKMWDVTLAAGQTYVFRQYNPILPPRIDAGLYLFDPSNGAAQAKADAVAESDNHAAVDGGEWITYTATTSGDHGLAMVMNNEPDDTYSLWWGPRHGLGDGEAVRHGHEVTFGASAVLSSDWVVWGARPNGGRDVDMWLMSDPAYTASVESSTGVDGVNLIVADRNHLPDDLDTYHPRFRITGDEGVSDYEYEAGLDEALDLSGSGETIDLAWPAGSVVTAYDLFLDGSIADPQEVAIEVEVLTGNMDLGLALFQSDNPGGESFRRIGEAEVTVDSGGAGGSESLTYATTSSDVFGVVIFNQNAAGGTYRLRAYDPAAVDTDESAPTLPRELRVSVDRNPLHRGTNVRYALPAPSPVNIGVFDVAGRLLRTLHAGNHAAGIHVLRWDGRGRDGNTVGAGVYFIRLETSTGTRVIKVVQPVGS